MTVPENTVYVDGGPAVDGDGLNTFVQTCNTMSDLRAFIGVSGMQVSVLGQNAVNDSHGGVFYWNATGTAADDNGVTTVVPSGSAAGIWSRLTPIVAISPTRLNFGVVVNPVGTTSTAGVMMGIGQTFTPATTGAFLLILRGVVVNDTLGDGAIIQMRYGTGPAPGNGNALIGSITVATEVTVARNGQLLDFCLTAYQAGLTVGTTYWLDSGLFAVTGGTAALLFVSGSILEM